MTGRGVPWIAGTIVFLSAPAALSAQTDPSGAYRTWTTQHFRIHARADLADAAERLAREAERAWTLLATELVPPRGRVDVTLFDNVDFANGFATVFPSNRITIFLTTPAGDVSLGHFDDWLRVVMTHELVHIFHLDRRRGIWNALSRVFGRAPGLFPNAYQPSWVVEGLATYYESRFTAAGRVRAGFHGRLLAARAGAGWPDPNDATFVSPAWPGGVRPYAWGSRFFTHQMELHGDSVVPRFIERTARQLWPLRISGPLSGAGGDPLDAGWAGLREAWSGRGPPVGRILVRGLRTEPRPRVNRAGRLALVRDDGRAVSHVVQIDLRDGRVLARHPTNGDAELAWVGDTLYVAQLDFDSPVEIRSDLYRWSPDGRWRRLTRAARLTTPFGVPRGQGVGVVTTLPGRRALSVYDPRDGALEPFASPGGTDWARVAVSPDGRWVAAARHAEGRWDLVVWPFGAPEAAVEVTADQALDADPAWTWDSRAVLFVSERFGLPQVFAYTIADGRVVRLTEEPTGASQPAMAPDGRLLYATVLPDGFAVVADDAPQPLRGASVAATAPVFTPAPAVEIAETGYRPWAALRPRYWLPFLTREGASGTFFGLVTSGSDPVGRLGYSAIVSYAPGSGRVDGQLAGRYTRWRALTVDASAEVDWGFAGTVVTEDGAAVNVSARERFATGGVTWRRRRWRSAAALRAGWEWEEDVLVPEGELVPELADVSLVRWGPVVSAAWSRTERPALAISPENGAAISGLYRRRWELGGPDWSNEWRGAASGYLALPLPGFSHWVLAANARVGIRTGPIPGRFALGGASGTVFEVAPGVGLGGRRSFPLRAYPTNRERFSRVAVGALELRVPLFLVAEGLWELPLGVDRVSLAVFAESGTGWEPGATADLLRYPGVGAEAVLDLALGADFALRMRVGLGIPLRDGLEARAGRARGFVTFGPSF